MERCGNRRPRVERLFSAWSQVPEGGAEPAGDLDDPIVEVATEPRRRTRTPLTVEEADAMRAARADGVSVTALAKQFGVHRGTT